MNMPAFGLRGPMLECKQPDSEWNFCACVFESAAGREQDGSVGRSSQWQSFILAAELLNLKEVPLEHCPRR